jgi:hypothetical protein
MITGEYIFYQDGIEIYRSKNLITKFGKRFITNIMAGNVNFNKQDVALGIANSTDYSLLDTNSRLGFEFYRVPVSFGSSDIETSTPAYYTVYKATIPQDVSGIIKEIGLYPGTRLSVNNFDSKFLSDFELNYKWYDKNNSLLNPTLALLAADSSAPRIGSYLLEHSFITGDTTSTTREFKYDLGSLDISGYSVNDTLVLAYNRANTNSSEIKIKFYSSESDYFYGSITPSGTGNKIGSISMSSVFTNQVGTPDSSEISSIGIEVTRTSAASAATIYLDGLRINDEDTFDPVFGLISRSVLATPLTKIAGRPVDIEYKLNIGF